MSNRCIRVYIKIFRKGMDDWQNVPVIYPWDGERGKGVADMACAIKNNRPHRANGDLAYHALDVMHALHDSNDDKQL